MRASILFFGVSYSAMFYLEISFQACYISSMISNVIKIKLQEILKKQDKTLYWLAKQTGISYNALAKINKNQVSRIELDTIEKICINLKCGAGDLLAIEK
jgi:putative transcriptional regulator